MMAITPYMKLPILRFCLYLRLDSQRSPIVASTKNRINNNVPQIGVFVCVMRTLTS